MKAAWGIEFTFGGTWWPSSQDRLVSVDWAHRQEEGS